ncbi:MAG: DUF4124 domain-containing protein [Hydrogenophaga sp.]|jgi:hypothetical protein
MTNTFMPWRRALLAALLGASAPAMAQIYTWTDADGKKHFSDGAMRPKDRATPEVNVPPPNVVDRFQAPPNAPAPPPPEPVSPPTAGAAPPAAGRPLSGVDRSQNACRAQWDAYYDGADCFAACGQNLGGSGARNNAACGHCTDAPRPNC